MSFSFVSIKETDRLKDVYPKINAIGEELSKPNSIYKQLSDLKTTVSKYQTYKLTTDSGQYTSGQVINLDTVQGSKTMYGTITNPPKGLSGEGWISYKESEGSNTTLVNFYPVDSDSIYTKVRKLPKQTQNPNLLHDTTFSGLPMYGSYTIPEGVWWDTNGDRTTVNYPDPTVKYQGINTVRLQDTATNYPMLRHKGLEVGKDVNVGDKLTFSAYVYTPDKSLFNGNNAYITITGYPGELGSTNTSLSTVNMYESDFENGQWKKITCTATVPSTVSGSPIQYVSAMLRLSLTKGGFDNGLKVYYALPKLEKGTVATPYVSHPDDKIQFNELWSEWSEQKSKLQSINDSVTDIYYDNYFKYVWWKDKVGTRTLQDLAYELPQGFHTFYAQKGIPGILPDASIRGTINVDYSDGKINQDKKFIQIYYMDYFGNFYTQYYDANKGWFEPIKSVGSRELWTGTQDLSNTSYIFNLNDNIYNYDYIEIDYYTYSDTFMDNKRSRIYAETDTITLNTSRLASSTESNSGFDFWQAQIKIINSNQMEPYYSKRVSVNSSSLSTVSGRNTPGLFTIKKIIGIKG